MSRLSAVNKWCVTGTPVGKSLNDLYGLLLFLQLDPYRVEAWWRLAVYTPYCLGDRGPMLEVIIIIIIISRDHQYHHHFHQVLRGLLWRTSKRDVLDQIDIPEQSDEVSWLQFSPVEEHFYRRQHIEISRDVVAKLRFVIKVIVSLFTLYRATGSWNHRPSCPPWTARVSARCCCRYSSFARPAAIPRSDHHYQAITDLQTTN